MEAVLSWLIAQARALLDLVVAHQQLALFASLLVEEAGVPLPAPGDLIVIYYASRHRDDPPALLVALGLAVLASVIGAQIPFVLARRYGQRVVEWAGQWLGVEEDQLERGRDLLRTRGFLAVVILRVIPGLRLPIALLAGVAGLPLRHYAPAVFGAAAVYWATWILVGLMFGEAIDALLAHLHLRFLLPLVALFAAGAIIVRRWRMEADRRSPAAH